MLIANPEFLIMDHMTWEITILLKSLRLHTVILSCIVLQSALFAFRCQEYCKQQGYLYYGVQAATECFCGNNYPDDNRMDDESSCSSNCPADPSLKCGAGCKMNIYLVEDSAEKCNVRMENDIDYGGNDVTMPDGKLKCSSPHYSYCTESSPVLNAPSCRSFCLESNYFTWKSSYQTCYCKNSNLGKAQQSGSTSGSTICPGKARIPICMGSKKNPHTSTIS